VRIWPVGALLTFAGLDSSLELHVLPQVPDIRDVFEIASKFRVGREPFRLVESAPDSRIWETVLGELAVHAGARVAVPGPDSARACSGVDYFGSVAVLSQEMKQVGSAEASSNYQDVKLA
jgi:hypothetical protein